MLVTVSRWRTASALFLVEIVKTVIPARNMPMIEVKYVTVSAISVQYRIWRSVGQRTSIGQDTNHGWSGILLDDRRTKETCGSVAGADRVFPADGRDLRTVVKTKEGMFRILLGIPVVEVHEGQRSLVYKSFRDDKGARKCGDTR